MDQLAVSDVWRWLTALAWLVIAAGIAFAVGLFVRYRRAAIQREYQKRLEESQKQTPKTGA